MATVRALFIDSKKREVRTGYVDGLDGMQKAVCGYIERAYTLENGDDVFVNEEGLLGIPEDFFYIEGAHQPFAGNAVIVGASDEEGDCTDARTQTPELKAQVTFMNTMEVLAFLRRRE